MEREEPWEEPVSAAETLWYRGFLFQTFEQGPDGAYEAVFVPPELREHLPAPKSAKPTIRLDPAPPPGSVVSHGDLLLDDACTLLGYVQNERPRLEPDREWTGRHKQNLLPRLRVQGENRLRFLCHLASRVGWVTEDEAGRLRPAPETTTAWLQSPPFSQRRAIAGAWRGDPTWNDLFHVPNLQPEDTGAWRNDPVLARQAILRHVAVCTPNAWYELDALIAAVKEVDPDFQRPAGDYESWYIRNQDTGVYVSGFESWDVVEGRLIRYLLTQPMAWLGLVDLGRETSDQPPHVFRLSEAGAAFIGLTEPPSPPSPPRAHLRPGFRVSMPSSRRYERFQLARVAQWVATGNHFVYRLTPASLKRAREQGIAISRVLEFLEEITEAPLPRPVEEALTRWRSEGTEVRLGRAVLLQVASETLMDQIASSPRLVHLIQERVGPKAALVRQQDWPQLVRRLEEIGLLPDVTELPK
jgi:hypothetical protein